MWIPDGIFRLCCRDCNSLSVCSIKNFSELPGEKIVREETEGHREQEILCNKPWINNIPTTHEIKKHVEVRMFSDTQDIHGFTEYKESLKGYR